MNRIASIVPMLIILIGSISTLFGKEKALTNEELAKIQFEPKLNSSINLDLSFNEETGKQVSLRQFFDGKPVILACIYYKCPMMCSLVLNGLIESLQQLKSTVGKDLQIVCVSIDPKDTPAASESKKISYMKLYGRTDSSKGWHFLTGSEDEIQQLTSEVGFKYAYDPVSKQYAHPSGIVVLTPGGKISNYLLGIDYAAEALNSALKLASQSQTSSKFQQLALLCFGYRPLIGKYSIQILLLVRISAVFTIIILVLFVRRQMRHSARNKPYKEETSP